MRNLRNKILLTLLTTSLACVSASTVIATETEPLLKEVTASLNPPSFTIKDREYRTETTCCCIKTRVLDSVTVETTPKEILEVSKWLSAHASEYQNGTQVNSLGGFGEHPALAFTLLDYVYSVAAVGAMEKDTTDTLPAAKANISTITTSKSVPGILAITGSNHTARVLTTERPDRPRDTFEQNVSIVERFCTATNTLETRIKVKVHGGKINPTREEMTFVIGTEERKDFWTPLVALGLANFTGRAVNYRDQPTVQRGITAVRALLVPASYSPDTLRVAAATRFGEPDAAARALALGDRLTPPPEDVTSQSSLNTAGTAITQADFHAAKTEITNLLGIVVSKRDPSYYGSVFAPATSDEDAAAKVATLRSFTAYKDRVVTSAVESLGTKAPALSGQLSEKYLREVMLAQLGAVQPITARLVPDEDRLAIYMLPHFEGRNYLGNIADALAYVSSLSFTFATDTHTVMLESGDGSPAREARIQKPRVGSEIYLRLIADLDTTLRARR